MIEMEYSPVGETQILHTGCYNNIKFAIISHGTHPCAYVECKIDGVDSYEDERLFDIEVHGGFTYLGNAYWDESEKSVFLGWDYAHYNDYTGYGLIFPATMRSNGKKWATAEIFEEVKSVIEQLLELEESEIEYYCD